MNKKDLVLIAITVVLMTIVGNLASEEIEDIKDERADKIAIRQRIIAEDKERIRNMNKERYGTR